MALPSFPHAQQAQIIRANQRDLFHILSLKEQTESVLRSWLGTRWMTRWDKELDLLVKLAYYGATLGRATQSLGEEYTNTWQYSLSSRRSPPSPLSRTCLILLPTLSAYTLNRLGSTSSFREQNPYLGWLLKQVPTWLGIVTDINLAIFYLDGVYYDTTKRLFGIRYISSIPGDPHTRPPSYSLLGVLLIIRLVHRLKTSIQDRSSGTGSFVNKKSIRNEAQETFLDHRLVASFLDPEYPESERSKPAEEDERTMLEVSSIPDTLRRARNCTLCLEERTDSCSTECGHLFCWSCIVGWGREKAECPLCRQSLNLSRLLPIYNL